MPLLITGATGTIGGHVTDQLLARGLRPRIFVRSAERARARFGDAVDVAVGDLTKPGSLYEALRGVDTLFLLNEGAELGARDEAATQVAEAAGVVHVVKLSSRDASRADTSATGAWHARGESALRASKLAWTFVRPVGFMSNALAWAAAVQKEGVIRASTGNGRIPMVHPDDVAAVAVAALLGDRYRGSALTITGPRALSYAEMAAIIGEAIGRRVSFEAITDEQAHARLLAHGLSAPVADALVELWRAVREGRHEEPSDDVERVLGRTPRSFEQWVAENAAAFRGER